MNTATRTHIKFIFEYIEYICTLYNIYNYTKTNKSKYKLRKTKQEIYKYNLCLFLSFF